jgi:hypothetical protein
MLGLPIRRAGPYDAGSAKEKPRAKARGSFFRRVSSVHDPEKWVPVFGKDHAQTVAQYRATTGPPQLNSQLNLASIVSACGLIVHWSPVKPPAVIDVAVTLWNQ